ncbi:MAG: 6-deoxyerythronolide-B synthase, partial [Ghiorsea sp.]|nr:6-deoxyerythronolide-B synthase [Ghiorsea sp.]
MIGQVATLHHEKMTVAALHESMVQESLTLIESIASPSTKEDKQAVPVDIAVVGVSTLLPGAHDAETYWQNILNKREVISEIPKERWDWRLYFDADRKVKDKIYMKSGGFFGEVPFDPMDFGIPPNSLRTIEPIQLLTLGVVQEALKDAGYESGNFDRENTSVILGASGGLGDLGVQYAARTELDKVVGKPSQAILDRLPDWNEESFSGLLLNVIAGRVANRFDLGGTNQTVDAACGSSLAALKNAVQELVQGTSNMALAGGVDNTMNPFTYIAFSKTQALSPSGTPRPFDKNSDGIVISEGISVVVLKRLADAERDGDRIYGVIKGMGSSSDGRALGMTAPLPKGQMRALDRAYHQAGYTPDTVALFEAHGTGTNAGDKAESETIISTLRKHQAKPKNSVLGSVKSQIGHTKATAGTAALIKTVLSLYYKTQPPHMNVTEPLDVITDSDSPVFILNQKRPWFASPEYPRRAGVSAFGFGGTNYHAALEEYTGAVRKQPTGAAQWPCELFIFKAESRERLLQSLKQLQKALAQGSQPSLRVLAAAYAYQVSSKDNVCLSFVADDLDMLQTLVNQSMDTLEKPDATLDEHIHFHEHVSESAVKVAFMYPGQGSQYVNMGIEHAVYFDAVRNSFELASQNLSDAYAQPLCDMVFPPSAYNKEDMDAQRKALTH